MSRLVLKQLNNVERRVLSACLQKRALTQLPSRSLSMSSVASKRLTLTKNWLSTSRNVRALFHA